MNASVGHGPLRDGRCGYARLRRAAWNELWWLQQAQVLTVIVALFMQAGFRAERLGVVLGNYSEFSDARRSQAGAGRGVPLDDRFQA